MNIKSILSKVDHTLLKQTATWDDIKQVCEDAVKYKCASACIPPYFVKTAKNYFKDKLNVCTVIGFPNGYSTTKVKCYEASQAVSDGADEIDMVLNINMLKDSLYDDILDEINQVKIACQGRILKVIIETCLLTEEEKIKMCEIISNSDADYIKTSTGFSTSGATREDIQLFKEHIKNDKRIKAAGGIKSLNDAEDFINLGASRLGTSSIVKIIKDEQVSGY
ncbi:MAG: deoxyribose-phosphate aldolase [Clostridia bacterium]|jgi:deoxyribose-phosphate aldolase|nr:deoxyribose-phosphate aldolase [Clostridia bacterium]MDD3971610.1 deoxyribose-phosphate aldolase [Clostridia bacterium]